MKTINKPSDNMGGLLKIWAVRPSDIATESNSSITFSSTDNIYEMYCTSGTMSFSEPHNKSNAGILYSPSLKAVVPKDTDDTLKYISEMERISRFVVIYLDGNGNYKKVGTGKVPVRFSGSLSSGVDTTDRNGFNISFSGKCTKRATHIQNPF
jgi:hypothetical protein